MNTQVLLKALIGQPLAKILLNFDVLTIASATFVVAIDTIQTEYMWICSAQCVEQTQVLRKMNVSKTRNCSAQRRIRYQSSVILAKWLHWIGHLCALEFFNLAYKHGIVDSVFCQCAYILWTMFKDYCAHCGNRPSAIIRSTERDSSRVIALLHSRLL